MNKLLPQIKKVIFYVIYSLISKLQKSVILIYKKNTPDSNVTMFIIPIRNYLVMKVAYDESGPLFLSCDYEYIMYICSE